MFVADQWQDFELIDCSNGEKLERWGSYYLVRPDPQAIWDTPRRNPHWNDRNARYHRSQTGGGSWDKGDLPENWRIRYGELIFLVKPMNFKHTGLFPEQAANWDFITSKLKGRKNAKVLNLFAYTGGATVAAAKAGASVTHVDASKGMVAWAKENMVLNHLENHVIRFIVDDALKFIQREQRRGNRYDVIIMDPPSYGRGPGGEVWKLEQNLWPFVSLCADVLSEEPLFLLINSYTTGLSPTVLSYVSESIFSRRFGGHAESRELGLPVTESGLVLPCGASCRHVFG